MSELYRPYTKRDPARDPDRCAARVTYYVGSWPRTKQCDRKGKHPEDGHMWCHQHRPSAVAERRRKHDEKHAAEYRRRRIEFAGPRLLAIVREIARGELNDPAGYAAMKLEELEL